MATQQITIFNNNLSSGSENLSAIFTEGIGFYLIAPASGFEYQIDIYLQVQVSNTTTRQVRLDPFNVSTTQRITLIPPQIVELGLPMRLAIVPSQGFFLEVILLQNDCSMCSIDGKLDAITQSLDELTAAQQDSEIDELIDSLEQTLIFFSFL